MDRKNYQREVRDAEDFTTNKIKSESQKLKNEEIQNSIQHLEMSLDKFLKEAKESDLENVYWHIGVIKAAAK